MMDQPIVLPVT